MRPAPDAPPAEKILFDLKIQGPKTTAALARRLGVTSVAVRQQLARLEADGLVVRETEAGRVGRPRHVWDLSPAASARFPDAHAELAVGFLESVRRSFGEDGLQKLVEDRRRAQQEAYRRRVPGPEAPLERRVAALAKLRRDEGYMAVWSRSKDGTFLLAENHCPICSAARVCVGLCAAELRLFRALLGPGVAVEREEYVLDGDRRCLYRIRADAG